MSVTSPKDLAAFLTNLTSLFEKEYDYDYNAGLDTEY